MLNVFLFSKRCCFHGRADLCERGLLSLHEEELSVTVWREEPSDSPQIKPDQGADCLAHRSTAQHLGPHSPFLFFCFHSHPAPWTNLTLILGAEGTWRCCPWLLSLLVNSTHPRFVSCPQSISSSSQKAGWFPAAPDPWPRVPCSRRRIPDEKEEANLSLAQPPVTSEGNDS